jgi:hypothetical protein
MATLFLGAIGAALAPAGFASLGYTIGAIAGGLLFPQKIDIPTQYGPRLTDLKVMASTYGQAVPKVYGSYRLAGNMIWSTAITETEHSSTVEAGGKGGGGSSVTTVNYTYSQSFALALCQGPIIGVKRIWANGSLIWSAETTADIDTLAASVAAATAVRIYTGSESQTADALIQADKGATSTPAYRGTAYIVFEELQLADFGNRTPNIEAEVVVAGSSAAIDWNTVGTMPTSYSDYWYSMARRGSQIWSASAGYPSAGNYSVVVTSHDGGANWLKCYSPSVALSAPIVAANPLGVIVMGGAGYTGAMRSDDGYSFSTVSHAAFANGINDILAVGHRFIALLASAYAGSYAIISDDGGSTWSTANLPASPDGVWQSAAYGNQLCVAVAYGAAANSVAISTDAGDTWSVTDSALPVSGFWNSVEWSGTVFVAGGSISGNYIATSSDGATWSSTALAGLSVAAAVGVNGQGGIMVGSDGGTSYVSTDDGTTWRALPSTPGPLYATVGMPDGRFVANPLRSRTVYAIVDGAMVTAATVTLASIVQDICTEAGLAVGDLDTTALTDTVSGYCRPRVMTARAALEPLMAAYAFDAVESDGKIKFVKRGGSVAATIAEADMAARQVGDQPGDALALDRTQDVELPDEVSVVYADTAAAYQTGTQYGRRLIGSSHAKSVTELPIALTSTQARHVADVLIHNTWHERVTVEFATSAAYSHLEPTDLATVAKDAATYTVRLTSKDEQGLVIKWRGVLDDASIYAQTAPGADISSNSGAVTHVGATCLALMDIPLLRDQDDSVGHYAAACGYTAGWKGGQIYKSTDAGASYSAYGKSLLHAAKIGLAQTALGAFAQNIFDESNTVSVYLHSGTLSSATEAQVLNGANAALLGSEVIQFKTATLTGTRTYTLSGLLRGRLGTEWAAATHVLGERFVLLESSTVRVVEAPSAEYGVARYYRGASLGGLMDDAAEFAWTHNAVARKPLSPVLVGGGRDASGNLTINWVRRTRIGGGWINNADVPLGEASESYSIDIYNGGSVVRTITEATATASYTAAQQTTDFGATQASISLVVYQVSAAVGRGYGASATI